MITGYVTRNKDGSFSAGFNPGWTDKFGDDYAYGTGPSAEHATFRALQNAETDFDFHGGVRFREFCAAGPKYE